MLSAKLVWGVVFKGQDSSVSLKAVSSGQVLFLFSFAADLWWPKQFSKRFRSLAYIKFTTFTTNHEAGSFTGEGISEVEGLMCSARMDNIGK